MIKLLEKLDNALHANVDTLFYNKDIEKVAFITNQIHILTVDLVKINRDNDSNFDESDPDTIIHVRLLAWLNASTMASKEMLECLHDRRWEKKK